MRQRRQGKAKVEPKNCGKKEKGKRKKETGKKKTDRSPGKQRGKEESQKLGRDTETNRSSVSNPFAGRMAVLMLSHEFL